MHLNPNTFLPLLCMIIAIICGMFVILQNPKAKLNRIFLGICITFAAWFSFYIPDNFYYTDKLLVTWSRISFCFISFIPIATFTFSSTYLQAPKYEFWIKINSLIGLTFSILSITTDWIIKGMTYYQWYPYPHAGVLHPLLVIHCIYLIYFSFKVMLKGLNDPLLTPKQRNHLKYLISSFGALSCGIFDFIPNYNIPIHAFGYIPVSIYLIITSFAIVRYQLMDIQIVFQKSLVYTILITIITIFYLMSIFFTEHILQSMFGYKSMLISLSSATFIAIAFIPLRNFIQNFIEKTFFKGSYMQIAEENELLRQEVTQTERMKAIAILASGMAHEIKNPLTTLKTFSEFVPQKKNDPEFMKQYQKIMPQEIDRIDNLVHELLLFAKPSPPQIQSINPNDIINNILIMLESKFNTLSIHVIKELTTNSTIQADPNQIKQALLNLILNAIDAMPNGGTLTIKTNPIPATSNVIPANAGIQTHQYIISITDTGHGIAPKDLPHIFEPFFTKKEKGTGLGLAITQGIIEKHGGRIAVESKINQGTKFTVILPL